MTLDAVARRLAALTLELVDIPSVSGGEDAISARVVALLGGVGLRVDEDGDGIVALPPESDRPLLLLAGHLDTVPVQDNLPGRIEDGDVVGLGSSDMKGAIAVMLALVDEIHGADAPGGRALDVGVMLVRREEMPVALSGTPRLLAAHPRLGRAALVLVMEPTGNAVEVGCMGNLTVEAEWHGRSAHSARPWQGVNAAHRAVLALGAAAAGGDTAVTIDDLEFREVTSVVRLTSGVADNVIPSGAVARVNHRYAPATGALAAEARMRGLLGADLLTVVSNAPAGRVVTVNPLLDQLLAQGTMPRRAKQAWTPVAEFTAAGLDAVNLGPGDGAQAHQQGERVAVGALVDCLTILRRLVLGPAVAATA